MIVSLGCVYWEGEGKSIWMYDRPKKNITPVPSDPPEGFEQAVRVVRSIVTVPPLCWQVFASGTFATGEPQSWVPQGVELPAVPVMWGGREAQMALSHPALPKLLQTASVWPN